MNALSLQETYDQATVMDEAAIVASLKTDVPLWKQMGKDEYRQYQYEQQCIQLEANLAAKAKLVFTPAPAPQNLVWTQMPMQQQRGALILKK